MVLVGRQSGRIRKLFDAAESTTRLASGDHSSRPLVVKAGERGELRHAGSIYLK